MLRQTLFTGAMLLVGAARAEGYEPKGLLTTGYFEHREEDGTWFVGANSRAHEGFGAAEHIAMYRAAALAQQQGHRYVQLLWIRTERMSLRNGPEIRETTHLEVRFADSAADPADCRQPKNYRDQCRTFDGVRVLASFAQEMGQEPPVLPPDLRPQPVPPGFLEASTLIRFTVGVEGQPSDCAIVESSAPPALAGTACALMLKRGRYIPARGLDGKPTAQVKLLRFRWQVPASGAPQPPALLPVSDVKPARPMAKPAGAPAPRAHKPYPHDDTVQTPM